MGNRYGRYEVMYKLGQGAMAQVFLARDPVLSRLVAIKVLHADLATRPDVLQRFFNEARTVAVVRNPHVVEVFDFGKEGQDLYLVMEFVDGQSLQGLLKQLRIPSAKFPEGAGSPERADNFAEGALRDQVLHSEPMDQMVAAALICQAAEGLAVAAQHGVVHRDIKPENLMINQQGYLKISDFGIAHVQDDSLTKTGAILGSPLYMSPEQARGLKPITSQADMFSLGSVFYTCLTGHPPFQGRSFSELLRKIVTEKHTPLGMLRAELDPALANLVEVLLQKDPKHRGAGPKWVHRQLQGFLMAAGIADSAELVRNYLSELSAQGVQTTWRSDGPPTTLAHTRKTIRFSRDVISKTHAGMWATGVLALGLIGGGLWYGLSPRMDRPAVRPATIAVAGNKGFTAGSQGNLPGTVAPSTRFASAPESAPNRLAAKSSTKPAFRTPQASVGAPEETAVLLLQSSPPFAEAFVDGRYVGVTPVRVDQLVTGRHRVVMKGKHAPTMDTLVALQSGSQTMKFKMDEGQPARLAGGQTDQP